MFCKVSDNFISYFEIQNCVKIGSHISGIVSKIAHKSTYQNIEFVLIFFLQ
jgi:hypothetical protein